jgi:thiol:disulfide interchange protein DsbD
MKQLLTLMLLIIGLFAISDNNFLAPNEAFKVNIFETKDNIKIKIDIDDTIYLYDDKLKIFIGKTDITKDVLFHKTIKYHGFTVHFGDMIIPISKKLIKKINGMGAYNIKVKYQGCSKKGLCYEPMNNKYSGTFK